MRPARFDLALVEEIVPVIATIGSIRTSTSSPHSPASRKGAVHAIVEDEDVDIVVARLRPFVGTERSLKCGTSLEHDVHVASWSDGEWAALEGTAADGDHTASCAFVECGLNRFGVICGRGGCTVVAY